MPALFRFTDCESIDKDTYKRGDLDYSRMGNVKNHGKNEKQKIPSDKAFWVFDMAQPYRPGANVVEGCVLLKINFTQTDFNAITNAATAINASGDTDTKVTGNSDVDFKGEAKHPDDILVKSNEKGAYGIGVNRLRNYAPLSIALASDDEVKNGLGDGKTKAPKVPDWYKVAKGKW